LKKRAGCPSCCWCRGSPISISYSSAPPALLPLPLLLLVKPQACQPFRFPCRSVNDKVFSDTTPTESYNEKLSHLSSIHLARRQVKAGARLSWGASPAPSYAVPWGDSSRPLVTLSYTQMFLHNDGPSLTEYSI
jgi:hypothetical protein